MTTVASLADMCMADPAWCRGCFDPDASCIDAEVQQASSLSLSLSTAAGSPTQVLVSARRCRCCLIRTPSERYLWTATGRRRPAGAITTRGGTTSCAAPCAACSSFTATRSPRRSRTLRRMTRRLWCRVAAASTAPPATSGRVCSRMLVWPLKARSTHL
jgi:hypothetical protein